MIRELQLADFGLLTVAEACALRDWSPKTLQNWIRSGLNHSLVLGGGRRTFVLRITDVMEFTRPAFGAQVEPKGKTQRRRKGQMPQRGK